MKKSMLILLSVVAYTFSLNDVSVPNRFTPSTPARSSEVNANFDTLASRINQNNDTIEQKFIRFSDLESGDSILEKCRIDTARIDHIRSNPEADSMTITKADINGGTIDGTVIGANSAAAGTFTTVTASGAIAGSTINTGNGAYEIGQSNRTTDSPTFSGLTLNNNANFGNTITFTGTNKWIISNTATTDKTSNIALGYPNTANSGYVGVHEINHATRPGDVVLQAGGSNGAIYMSPRAYFGTRPANDYSWQLAFNDRFCLSADANWSLLTENLYYNSGWRRRKVASAAFLGFNGGNLSLQTAPTGTADTVISSLNQNIFSNDSGNTAFGKNTFVGGYKVEVEGNTLVNGTLNADSIKSTKGILATTLNTGNGNNELYPMNQGVRTTDDVTFDSVRITDDCIVTNRITGSDLQVSDSIIGVTGTFSGGIKGDSITSQKGINCATINTGLGNFEIGQSLRTNEHLIVATINTGNGATEVYEQNQNLKTTDDVTFDSTTVRVLRADSIRVSTSFSLNSGWYSSGYFLATLSGFTTTITDTIRYVKIGEQVTLTFCAVSGTRNASGDMTISMTNMPSTIKPKRDIYVSVTDNGILGIANPPVVLKIGPSTFLMSDFSSSGPGGFLYAKCVTYSLQ